MKVSREQAAANRDRIVATAARLFRERGFDGVSVADIMNEAGLTHGGFYGHFESKDALAAEACGRSLGRSAARWKEVVDTAEHPYAALVEDYVSARHRDTPGKGCILAALACDASRRKEPVSRSVAEGLQQLVDILEKQIPGRSKEARRRKALAAMSQMVGAIVLSRLVGTGAVSEEILQASRADLLAR